MPNQETVNVEVSSYTKGGTFESGSFRTLGDLLREYQVSTEDSIIHAILTHFYPA